MEVIACDVEHFHLGVAEPHRRTPTERDSVIVRDVLKPCDPGSRLRAIRDDRIRFGL